MASRKRTPDDTETEVLVASRRRCALCFGLFADSDQKRGQIAHVDRNPANASFDNLAFLCLPHHDEYDSKTSQSKRFTPSELMTYRGRLYERFHDRGPGGEALPAEALAAPSIGQPKSRALTATQRRAISQRLRSWAPSLDDTHARRVTICASPTALDARNYAAQIRMALEAGGIQAADVWDFTWGDDLDDREQYRELNAQMLNAHRANVTIWGSDTDQHQGEPLDQVLIEAFVSADMEVTHRPGPTSVGGMIAIIVGAGGQERQD